jgi:hypothetical protein
VNRRRGVSDVFCEVLHHGDGSDDACIVSEKETTKRTEDACYDIARRLLELASELHSWRNAVNNLMKMIVVRARERL